MSNPNRAHALSYPSTPRRSGHRRSFNKLADDREAKRIREHPSFAQRRFSCDLARYTEAARKAASS